VEVGLGEVLLLRQVTQLAARVRQFYPVGIRFSLLIDNLSAFLVEDVAMTSTLAYCRNLRRLVDDLGLSGMTDLIVTSECFSVADFAEAWPRGAGVPDIAVLTTKTRPADRVCRGEAEDGECGRRIQAAHHAADRLLAPMIRGVHLSERATTGSLGFRPYPGGEASRERGEIVLTRAGRTALTPMRLTAANHADYQVERHAIAGLVPSAAIEVGYAERVKD
jgi:hypothetical protein